MSQQPSVFVAHDVPDLINSVPTWFGFGVEESLVAVSTSGPRRRFGFRLRLDVPAPEHVDVVASTVVGHLGNHGGDGAIVMVLTEHQEVALDLLDAVHAGLDRAGITMIVRARADGRRYWVDDGTDPDDGTPYETSDHHLAIVQAVAAGQQILPDRASLVDRFAEVTGERRRWLHHATGTVLAEIAPVVARRGSESLAQVGLAEVEPILARGAAGGRLLDADLLRVAVWVSHVEVRDAVWRTITRDDAADTLRVLTLVARTVVPPFVPAVLSLTAFAAWLTGDGAQAMVAVERALRADPGYSMALGLLGILEQGVSPEHWGGFDPER